MWWSLHDLISAGHEWTVQFRGWFRARLSAESMEQPSIRHTWVTVRNINLLHVIIKCSPALIWSVSFDCGLKQYWRERRITAVCTTRPSVWTPGRAGEYITMYTTCTDTARAWSPTGTQGSFPHFHNNIYQYIWHVWYSGDLFEMFGGLFFLLPSIFCFRVCGFVCEYNWVFFLRALLEITPSKRPFVLSRSTFSGTSRYASKWLGDNRSQWSDMHWSIVGMSTSAHSCWIFSVEEILSK